MRDRPLGLTALAFSSIMVALYCQMAAIVLLLMGSVFTAAGSMPGAVVLFVGTVFLGLAVASYLLGFGFWTGKQLVLGGRHGRLRRPPRRQRLPGCPLDEPALGAAALGSLGLRHRLPAAPLGARAPAR